MRYGRIAGALRGDGYRQVYFEGRKVLEHRLAWFFVTGKWPENEIDHRDMIKDHNWFSNLREATPIGNGRNRNKSSRNTSGFKGVSWNSQRRAWQVTIRYEGRNKNLGYFATREMAARVYDNAALKHHGEFARPNGPNGGMTMFDEDDYAGLVPVEAHVPRDKVGYFYRMLGELHTNAGAPAKSAAAALRAEKAAEVAKPGAAVEGAPQPEKAADPAPATGEIDADGHPWSEALHASTKTQTKDGRWRMKVGVTRPEPLPGFPKDGAAGAAGASGGASGAAAPAPAAPQADEDDEFAAFREAAAASDAKDGAAAGKVTARKWTDADLGKLCNQAAVKLGDPAPVKALIAEFVSEGGVAHSRNIPEEKREDFAKAVEAKAGITFEG